MADIVLGSRGHFTLSPSFFVASRGDPSCTRQPQASISHMANRSGDGFANVSASAKKQTQSSPSRPMVFPMPRNLQHLLTKWRLQLLPDVCDLAGFGHDP